MPAAQQHKNWSVQDFERYHSGKMTEAEMHALEKAALDDPFLEDALEGYAFTKTPVADISELSQKLWPQEAEVKTPVIWFKRKAVSQLFKAAAIVILFGGIGWIIFNNANKKEGNPATDASLVADNKQNATPKASFDSLYNLNDSAPIIAKLDNDKINEAISKDQQLMVTPGMNSAIVTDSFHFKETNAAFEKDEMKRNDDRAKDKLYFTPGQSAKPAAPVTDPSLAAKTPGAEVEVQNDKVFAKKYDARPDANGSISNQQANAQNQVRGRVVDNSGNAVPFATVRNNADGRQAAISDADGNFVLNNANNSNVRVDVNATGYDQASKSLNNNSGNNTIVLNQSQNAMSEVVVTEGYSAKRKSRETYQWNGKNTRIHLKNAEPLEGWPYFYYVMNDSIANNKILNQQRGRIILQFDTDPLGVIKNIVIKKSLNDSSDNAAMRMFYKSPVLKVKNPSIKGEATIKLGL